jgi:hypothetical protein
MFYLKQCLFYCALEKPKEAVAARAQLPAKEEMTRFWQEIWSQDKRHNEQAIWLNDLKHCLKNCPEQKQTSIAAEQMQKVLRTMKNWKAPGPDMVHAFWLKKLTSVHNAMVKSLQNILTGEEELPLWLSNGTTHLLLKEGKDSWDPNNYRPITCLPSTWKLLTGILANELSDHLSAHKLLAQEQKGCCPNSRGTKDQLMVDKMVMTDSRSRKTNLSMCWIDYKKAFDSVPHSWIIECLKLYKVSNNITSFIERSMENWETSLTIKGEKLGQVRIRSGIYQGDAISPLLFCLAMNPVSQLVKDTGLGYKLKSGQRVSHLLYMDDLKLYASSERALDNLVQTVRIFSDDIGMTFGLDKCAKVVLHRGKLAESKDLQLPSGTIRDLAEGAAYKYLGIEEHSQLEHSRMKSKK